MHYASHLQRPCPARRPCIRLDTDGVPRLDGASGSAQCTSSIRSRATRAQCAVSSGTLITIDRRALRPGSPGTRPGGAGRSGTSSRTCRPWARGSGSSCRGVSAASRLTRCSSVPTAQVEPAGASVDRLEDEFGRADQVGRVDDRIMHSGWTRTLMPGNCSRNCSTCAGLNIWWTEQCPRQSRTRLAQDRLGRVAAQGLARVPDGICSSGMPIARAVLRPRCWSGKNEHRACGGRTTIRARPGRSSWCRRCRRAGRRTPSGRPSS